MTDGISRRADLEGGARGAVKKRQGIKHAQAYITPHKFTLYALNSVTKYSSMRVYVRASPRQHLGGAACVRVCMSVCVCMCVLGCMCVREGRHCLYLREPLP